MTLKEEYNRAMHEHFGWRIPIEWASVTSPFHAVYRRGDELRLSKELPDYYGSLDAMFEAEKTLRTHAQRAKYAVAISELTGNDDMLWDFIHVDSKIRCRAFLRTVGKLLNYDYRDKE